MKATYLKKGTKIQGSTGMVIEIAKATETRVSWFVGFQFHGGNGINKMKMAWVSLKQAQIFLDNKEWIIL